MTAGNQEMIQRIISSGQTGVELAALDAAIKLGVSHGGWTARGKRNAQGPLSAKYNLHEVTAVGFQTAMEQNIMESDGTLLITRGAKSPRTERAVQLALKHQRQLLHVDLTQNTAFEAASLVNSWASLQQIKIAFVTGTQAETEPDIHPLIIKILETAFYLGFVKSSLHHPTDRQRSESTTQQSDDYPFSVIEAVRRLKSVLSLKDRAHLANIQVDELNHLRTGLSEYIKHKFGLYAGNRKLLDSCAETGRLDKPLVEEACAVILRSLWEDLQQTHKLRIVK